MVLSKNSEEDNTPLLVIDKTIYKISSLVSEVNKIRAKQPQDVQDFMPIYIQIDEAVPMRHVIELMEQLAVADIKFLRYVVLPKNMGYNKRYYSGLNRVFLVTYNPSSAFFTIKKLKPEDVANPIQIDISNSGYILNNSSVDKEELTNLLTKSLTLNIDYGIFLNFKEEVNFGTYMGILISVNEAIHNLRNTENFDEVDINKHQIVSDEEYEIMKKEYRRIVDKYPQKYIENWEDSGIKGPKIMEPSIDNFKIHP